jgi:RNA polymerase sigma-70 factor (ECF subfamily)
MVKTFELEFVNQLKAGNAIAQRQLFDSCYPSLINVCKRYLVRIDEAEDCVLRSLLKVYKNINTFKYSDTSSLYHWIKRIVVNESLMQLRKKQLFGPLFSIDEGETSYDSEIIEAIDAKYLLELITKLPTGYRTVFNLFVIEGYSHKEISKMLNISESTSKSQLNKARMYLQKLISDVKYGYKTR